MADLPFALLDPDTVLTTVEEATGRRVLNICRPHNSYINRVYELQDEQGTFLIVKFYRPQRWSSEALRDELDFVGDCADNDLPVIAPQYLQNGSRLGVCRGIHFAVYPRCGGRVVDEYHDEQWLELGRLLGRVHQVGRLRRSLHRNRIHPLETTQGQLDYILDRQLVPKALADSFRLIVSEIIRETADDFTNISYQRIHGDCHGGNLIYRPEESFFIIDFDDMAVGPVVQDLWMLLPGRVDECGYVLELFLEGYETFSNFDRRTIDLIEPLRAMRFVHYISWCARQYVEDGDTRVNEAFGTYEYWQQEIGDLEDQLQVIRKRRAG